MVQGRERKQWAERGQQKEERRGMGVGAREGRQQSHLREEPREHGQNGWICRNQKLGGREAKPLG